MNWCSVLGRMDDKLRMMKVFIYIYISLGQQFWELIVVSQMDSFHTSIAATVNRRKSRTHTVNHIWQYPNIASKHVCPPQHSHSFVPVSLFTIRCYGRVTHNCLQYEATYGWHTIVYNTRLHTGVTQLFTIQGYVRVTHNCLQYKATYGWHTIVYNTRIWTVTHNCLQCKATYEWHTIVYNTRLRTGDTQLSTIRGYGQWHTIVYNARLRTGDTQLFTIQVYVRVTHNCLQFKATYGWHRIVYNTRLRTVDTQLFTKRGYGQWHTIVYNFSHHHPRQEDTSLHCTKNNFKNQSFVLKWVIVFLKVILHRRMSSWHTSIKNLKNILCPRPWGPPVV